MTRNARITATILSSTAMMAMTASDSWAAPTTALRRAAVIVGANAAAAGRKPLRFAHHDAREVADVLKTVGGFTEDETHVLLDPKPDELLAVVDREVARLREGGDASMLLFYYSGHANERALFPSGRALPFASLRERLDDASVSLRIGIIDTCRGGGWTGSRGLQKTEPFEVEVPIDLSSEGSVLIASSSGLENAHESEVLQAGFFTHHWNAALRGAGDRNGDRSVTLTEAYEYAKALTVRDTALRTETPQHPSFRMNLRGRRDLSLAQLTTNPTQLEVHQDRGPIQLVHLDTGLIVLELPAGKRSVALAVAPGRYVVRTGSGETARAQEVNVEADQSTSIQEGELQLVGRDQLVMRSYQPRPATLSSVPSGRWDQRVRIGSIRAANNGAQLGSSGSDLSVGYNLVVGLSDRWNLNVLSPFLVYRGGTPTDFEWLVGAGLSGWGLGFSSINGTIVQGTLRTSFDLRWWLSHRATLQTGVTFGSSFRYVDDPTLDMDRTGPDSWRGRVHAGYSYTIADTVTLSLGVSYGQNLLIDGDLPSGPLESPTRRSLLRFGSVQDLGSRTLPLVQVHLSDSWSLDALATVGYDFEAKGLVESYAIGFTVLF